MSGRIHLIHPPALPYDLHGRRRREQEEPDSLTKAYQYNLWVQSLLEPTFHHIRQMTEGAVDIRLSLDHPEGPSYQGHLEYAQACLMHWLTKHAGLPRHVAEDKAKKELIFMEGWTTTTLSWNQEGWDEKSYGPKPEKYAFFENTVAGAQEDLDADDSPSRGFQDMSGVKEDSQHPIRFETWKPSRPVEMREDYEQAMKTKHREWSFLSDRVRRDGRRQIFLRKSGISYPADD